MASYKLSLSGLPFGSHQFNYHLNGDFFTEIGECEVCGASVDAQLRVKHEHEGIYELHFDFSGTLLIPCDRCLDEMELPVSTSWEVQVKSGERYDDSHDDVIEVPASLRELDLQPLMRDTVLLTIPIMHTHPEGQCNPEMMEQLAAHEAIEGGDEEENDKHSAQGNDPRWDALRQLLDKKQ